MANTTRRVEYYYVTDPDSPREGQRILSALSDGGVNLHAYLSFLHAVPRITDAFKSRSFYEVDLVPEDPDSLKKVAEEAGVQLSEAKHAFLVQGDDRVGVVADTVQRLADANINVTAMAATAAGSARYGMVVWVAPDDYERAADVLGA